MKNHDGKAVCADKRPFNHGLGTSVKLCQGSRWNSRQIWVQDEQGLCSSDPWIIQLRIGNILATWPIIGSKYIDDLNRILLLDCNLTVWPRQLIKGFIWSMAFQRDKTLPPSQWGRLAASSGHGSQEQLWAHISNTQLCKKAEERINPKWLKSLGSETLSPVAYFFLKQKEF